MSNHVNRLRDSKTDCCRWLCKIKSDHDGVTEGYSYDQIAREVFGPGYDPELTGRLRWYAHRIAIKARGYENFKLPDIRERSHYEYGHD